MYKESREILPVAAIDDERRMQIQRDMLATIIQSLSNEQGLTPSSEKELDKQKDLVDNRIKELAANIAAQQQIYA